MEDLSLHDGFNSYWMKLIPNGRIWIDTENGAFLGYGRIELLEKINETGSLRKAAMEMKMSYQQAWHLIKQMNENAGEALVTLQRGGKNGGTTLLTAKALELIQTFKDFNDSFQEFLRAKELLL